MRPPLLLPGIAFVVIAGVLVVLLRQLFELQAQPRGAKAEQAEPEEVMTEPRLPRSSQGRPSRRADLEMTVRHQAPVGSRCGDDCPDTDHWLVRLKSDGTRGTGAVGRLHRFGNKVMAIRAPAEATIEILAQCLREVAPRGVYQFEIMVTSAENGSEQSIACKGVYERSWKGQYQEASLRRRPQPDGYERRMSLRADSDAPAFSDDEAGNRLLQEFLRRRFPENVDRCLAVIGVANDVSMQALVDFLDQLRIAGIQMVELRIEQ